MEDETHTKKSASALLTEIEGTHYFRWMGVAADLFQKARDLAQEQGEVEIAEHSQFEIEICLLGERTPWVNKEYRDRFGGAFGYTDGSWWPSLYDFSEEQFNYYEFRLHETANPFLKSRYADVLFECHPPGLKLNRFELGKILVSALMECGEAHLHQTDSDYPLFLNNVARSADVAIRLKNVNLLSPVIERLVDVVKNFADKEFRWVYETSLIMRGVFSGPLKSEVSDEICLNVVRRVDEARAFFLESEDWLDWHRSFCEELIAWGRLLQWTDVTLAAYRREIGESYEREAKIYGKKYGSNMLKARILEEAIEHYANIGVTEKIDELKVRLRETYSASREESHPISLTVEIPMKEIESRLSPYKELSLSDSLFLLASDESLVVDVAWMEERTAKRKEASPFMFEVTGFVVDDDRKVFQSDSDQGSFKLLANDDYSKALLFTIDCLLKDIFQVLSEQRGMTAADVTLFLMTWPLLDERNAANIEVGIERLFAKDYVSALHILVPQLESCVRRMFAQAGYATTAIKRGTTQHEQTFTEFLERKEVKDELGINIHKYLQMVMVDQTGFNLRNDIAHGLIKPEDCNETNCLMVIHLLLILTRYRLRPGEAQDK